MPDHNPRADFFSPKHACHDKRIGALDDAHFVHAVRHRIGGGVELGLHPAAGDAGCRSARGTPRSSAPEGCSCRHRARRAHRSETPAGPPPSPTPSRRPWNRRSRCRPRLLVRPPRTPPRATCPRAVRAFSTRGSEATTRPTNPSSGSSCSAVASPASIPVSPTAFAPAAPSAATSCVFTVPARTFSTASMVSSVVTRSPPTKRLWMPRSSRKRVICLPPPCTTVTGDAGAPRRRDLPRDIVPRGGIVQQTPADFDQRFHVTAARRLLEPQREVQILDRLARRAFAPGCRSR